jgi:hypothetical protein
MPLGETPNHQHQLSFFEFILPKSNSLCRDLTAFSQSPSFTTKAKFNSDEPWAIIITFTSSFATEVKILPAIPLIPRRPDV